MSESTWIMCTNCGDELHCGGCGVPYIPPPLTCNCGQCGRMHDSDCAVHSEPAYPKGACTCEGVGEETPCKGCGGRGWYEGVEPDPRDQTGMTPMQVQIQCPCKGVGEETP